MTQQQNSALLVGAAFVLAVVIAGAGLFLVLSRGKDADTTDGGSLSSTTSLFNLQVLDRQAYRVLNPQPVQEGALPVQPPANIGKPNPFR